MYIRRPLVGHQAEGRVFLYLSSDFVSCRIEALSFLVSRFLCIENLSFLGSKFLSGAQNCTATSNAQGNCFSGIPHG